MANEIEILDIVSHETFEPYVQLKWGEKEALLAPHEARQHALRILATAEAAEQDSLVLKTVLECTKDLRIAIDVVQRVRKMRGEIEELRALNGERKIDDA